MVRNTEIDCGDFTARVEFEKVYRKPIVKIHLIKNMNGKYLNENELIQFENKFIPFIGKEYPKVDEIINCY